jgi:hypothetical protein
VLDFACGGTKPIGLTWIGTRTIAFDETVAFFQDVVGLPLGALRPSFARFDLPDGGALEVFRPGGALDHPHLTTGPMAALLVEDLDLAEEELRRHRVEIFAKRRDGRAGSTHFRATDGTIFEFKRLAE